MLQGREWPCDFVRFRFAVSQPVAGWDTNWWKTGVVAGRMREQ